MCSTTLRKGASAGKRSRTDSPEGSRICVRGGGNKRSASHPTRPNQIAPSLPPPPHHEDAVIVHVGLNFPSEPLALRARRRRLGRAALHPLLLAPPVLCDSLQHQLPLLEVCHAPQGERGAPLSGQRVKQCDDGPFSFAASPPWPPARRAAAAALQSHSCPV